MNALPLLVLGDIHNAWRRAESLLRTFEGQYGHALLLGDYFDHYGDTPEDAALTAQWLQRSVTRPDRTHLLGNHDLPYVFPQNVALACPGFSADKYLAAANSLTGLVRDRLKLAHFEAGWLFSHAGFTREIADGHPPEYLARKANRLLGTLAKERHEPWLACGRGRGGTTDMPGITWADWAHEFMPTPGIHQIVGHTPGETARSLCLHENGSTRRIDFCSAQSYTSPHGSTSVTSTNWCLDTRLRQVAFVWPERVDLVDVQIENDEIGPLQR